VVFDYFTDHRTDIFLSAGSRKIPQYFGAAAVSANLGETKTKGYEIEVKLQNTSRNQFYYWSNFTFAHAIDEVIFIEDPVLLPDYQKNQGHQIGQYYTQFSNGFYNNWDDIYASTPYTSSNQVKLPGQFDMVDFNGDGVLDSKDSAPYSYPSNRPQDTYQFSLGADFKGFSAMVQFYGVYNISGTYSWIMRPYSDRFYSVFITDNLNQWTPTNTETARWPAWRFQSYADALPASTMRWVDNSYFRLKTAEIAYTLSSKSNFIKKAGLNSLKIYVNGNNLYLWNKRADDREIAPDSNESYPMFKRYNVGVNFTF
jgi:hypothetical protein